jgi:hypothetical protein
MANKVAIFIIYDYVWISEELSSLEGQRSFVDQVVQSHH